MKSIFIPMIIHSFVPISTEPSIMYKPPIKENIFNLINRGNIKAVYSSINQGTSVNSKNCKGQSLLHYAVCHNQIEIAKLLIYLGADIYYTDNAEKRVIDTIHENHHEVLLNSEVVIEFSKNFIMHLDETEVQVDELGTSHDCCCIM